jgi:DNA-binding NarL/FixJ family response regulator
VDARFHWILFYVAKHPKAGEWKSCSSTTSTSSIRRLIHTQTTFNVVAEASDGREALELLKTLRPDVVITDVKMPNLDGVELTREIKRLYPHIHILALTSVPDDETSAAMREAGASGFIAKGDNDRLNYALDVTRAIGPDRRWTDRPHVIKSIWDSSSVSAN